MANLSIDFMRYACFQVTLDLSRKLFRGLPPLPRLSAVPLCSWELSTEVELFDVLRDISDPHAFAVACSGQFLWMADVMLQQGVAAFEDLRKTELSVPVPGIESYTSIDSDTNVSFGMQSAFDPIRYVTVVRGFLRFAPR